MTYRSMLGKAKAGVGGLFTGKLPGLGFGRPFSREKKEGGGAEERKEGSGRASPVEGLFKSLPKIPSVRRKSAVKVPELNLDNPSK